MANISDYGEKAMLDWVLGGATPTRPASWGLGICTSVPNDATASVEATTLLPSARLPVVFGAAASPAGSAVNATAVTFGPFTASGVISAVAIFDTVTQNGAGNPLWWGTLATARTVASGDSLVIASGALIITLA